MNTRHLPFLVLAVFFVPLSSYGSGSILNQISSYPDFALHIERARIDITYKDTDSEAEIVIGQFSISFAEAVTDWLKIRLKGGSIGFGLSDSLNGDPFDPTGFSGALSFEFSIPVSDSFALTAFSEYQHMKLDDDVVDELVKYSVDQINSEIGITVHLSSKFTIEAGVNGLWLDGRERFRSADTTNSHDFEASQSDGVYVRSIIHTGSSGHIGVTASSGARESLSIFFKNAY